MLANRFSLLQSLFISLFCCLLGKSLFNLKQKIKINQYLDRSAVIWERLSLLRQAFAWHAPHRPQPYWAGNSTALQEFFRLSQRTNQTAYAKQDIVPLWAHLLTAPIQEYARSAPAIFIFCTGNGDRLPTMFVRKLSALFIYLLYHTSVKMYRETSHF